MSSRRENHRRIESEYAPGNKILINYFFSLDVNYDIEVDKVQSDRGFIPRAWFNDTANLAKKSGTITVPACKTFSLTLRVRAIIRSPIPKTILSGAEPNHETGYPGDGRRHVSSSSRAEITDVRRQSLHTSASVCSSKECR